MIVTAFNPEVEPLERTFLAQSYPLGITTFEVKNNDDLGANDRLMIGEMGQEKTEIVTFSSASANGTTVVITSATLFSHEANTPVYRLQFDQVKFYRSTNGSSGTYNTLALVGMDVDAANLNTTYDDNTAQSTYYYKVTMFHSLKLIESAMSDPIQGVVGYARNQVGYLIDQIYQEISDLTEENLKRSELIGYFNEVNDDLQAQVAKPYRFLYKRTILGRTAAANSFAYPTDSSGNQLMWKFDRIDYNFIDNTTTPVTNVTFTVETTGWEYFRNRFRDNTNTSVQQNDMIQEITLNDATKTFIYYPPSSTTASSVFYLYYWKYFDRITSEGNVFETYSNRVYKLFAMAKYYWKRSVTEPSYQKIAAKYEADYTVEKARYKMQDRFDAGTPRRMTSENWITKSFRR